MRVLAFDIGIKNLAYCVLEKTARNSIIAWENVNIFNEDSAAESDQSNTVTCSRCQSKPKFYVKRIPINAVIAGVAVNTNIQTSFYCQRHLPPDRPPIKDASGAPFTTIPSLVELKDLAAKSNSGKPQKQTKDAWVELLEKQYAFPVKKEKKRQVMHAGLEAIHDALIKVIKERWDTFKTCNVILLENQPVFKNPTMKSVQVLLFATLRGAFIEHKLPVPRVHLVHAGKKVAAEKGDAGYAARKEGSETRATAWIQGEWKEFFAAAKKKSDLADALCMCLDYKLISG
jgi:hypothetical protein